jgi:uncharacterized protein YdcH (DUF465 family)
MFENRIKHLEEAHRALDKQVDTLEKSGLYEDLKLEELKKQRLFLKDELAILRRKQDIIIEDEARKGGLEL